MTKRRFGGPRGLNELMGATLGTARIAKGVQKARAILLWPQAAGPEIARITRPRSQQGGTLFIEVRDSATAHHLTMQRHHFLKALNELMPDAPLTELRFSVGSIKTPVAVASAPPLPAPDKAKARKLVQGVSEELRPAALRAAEAITRARKWREEQGWRTCPVCGEASREQPCRACVLTLQDANVRRAARTLQRQPERQAELTEILGNSGVNAARYLALGQLAEQLELLALECLRSVEGAGTPDAINAGESYRAFLSQQAELYLSLYLNKPRAEVERKDRANLPEGPRNVLNAGR